MEHEKISYFVFENEMNRLEIHNKRMFIIILILITVIICTNGAWIYHESLYVDEIEETYTTTTDGDNAVFVNGNGELHYNDENNVQEDADTP